MSILLAIAKSLDGRRAMRAALRRRWRTATGQIVGEWEGREARSGASRAAVVIGSHADKPRKAAAPT
jgi:hypothetical protein